MKTFALNKRKPLLIVTFLCSIFFGFSQTTLTAGDIAITGYQADYPDAFTFVLFTDVQASTQIKFTDNGWQTSGNFRFGEGILVWTATTDLPCGTEVSVDYVNPVYVASIGTITDDNNFNLATNGDHILAYQGDELTPTFLYAIHFASGTGWSNATTAQRTALPPGLTDGLDAVYLGNYDNGNYTCSETVDPALILTAISTPGNWLRSNDSVGPLGGCTYGCYSCATTTTWDGSNWDNGNPTSTTEVIIDGTFNTAVDLPGSFDACSLTITVNGSLRVSDGDYVTVENDITTLGTFIVNPEGSVMQIDDNANVIGSASVSKRTALMYHYYEYTYWSSPVIGETIGGGLTDADPTRRFYFEAANFKDSFMEVNNDGSQNPGQDDIDDNNDDWQFTPATTVMSPGVGYVSHHEEALFTAPPPQTPPFQFIYTFEGPFNNGVISVPVLRNDTPPLELGDINWNLIGNPYPSAIDIDLFFTENNYDVATNPDGTLTGAVYLWSQNSPPDDTNNGNENLNFTDDYAIINRVGVIPAQEVGGDGVLPSRYIPSGQGFFVAYSDARPSANGNVVFNNSMRVTGNNDQFFRSSSSADNKLALKLTTEDGIFNQMLVGYVEGATNLNDGMYYDAPRNLATGAAAIIYSLIEDSARKFAIQGRDPNSLDLSESIPIGVKNNLDGETVFTISIAQLQGDFMNNYQVFIKDNLLNVNHNLSESAYTFTSEAGEFNSRFEIFFSETLSVDKFSLNSGELIISRDDENIINISTQDHSQISNVKIYDLLGRKILEIEGYHKTNVRLNTSSLSNSVFIMNVTTSDRKKLKKKFLN